MRDTQNETTPDNLSFPIEAGINDFRTKLKIGDKIFIPNISVLISLNGDKRGIHMSRIVQSIYETSKMTGSDAPQSLEDAALTILSKLKHRHEFYRGKIHIETQLSMPKITPFHYMDTDEVYDISLEMVTEDFGDMFTSFFKKMHVTVIGASSCPHAMQNNEKEFTHIQRVKMSLCFTCHAGESITFEDLIKCCNKSFSSETYSLLKTEDEQSVVNTIHDNPRFVEDISRHFVMNFVNAHEDVSGEIDLFVQSEESIHKHNAISHIKIRV